MSRMLHERIHKQRRKVGGEARPPFSTKGAMPRAGERGYESIDKRYVTWSQCSSDDHLM